MSEPTWAGILILALIIVIAVVGAAQLLMRTPLERRVESFPEVYMPRKKRNHIRLGGMRPEFYREFEGW